MNNRIILDASAILALIKEEKGSEILNPHLDNFVASSVNIAEVLSVLSRIGFEITKTLNLLLEMIPQIIFFDIEHAKIASTIHTKTYKYGLSLGDRACIALGVQMNLPIYTADKVWRELNLDNAEIIIIR